MMKIKEKLKKGQTVLGTFVKINSPAVVEILDWAGFEFAIIDCEHSPFSPADVENLIRAGGLASLAMIVRVPSPREEHILHALDSGAAGVQLPGLTSVADVKRAIRNAKYYPQGTRGLSYNQRAARYGLIDNKSTYMKEANEETLIVVHIENRDMVDQIEAICDLPLIDVVFIGPVDLSQSFGKPGDSKDTEVRGAIERVFQVCKQKSKAVGIFVGSAAEISQYKDMGAQYIVYSSDVGMLAKEAKAAAKLI
jgi:4-hydroxy-2-oxoheptanedioate aldolase